jgi:hypothetical protein
MIRDRNDLATKQRSEKAIGPACLIHRRDVDQLVVHEDVHAFVAGDRLEREIQRSDFYRHYIARHR